MTADDTGPSAVGTGLLVAQGRSLAFEQRLQGAFGETGRRRLGDLLHRVEIDLKSGSVVAEGAARHDFAPLRRELTEFPHFIRRQIAPCHPGDSLALTTNGPE